MGYPTWSWTSAIPQISTNLEEALDDPLPLEVERVEEQEKEKKDSTFIWDIGLEEKQEMEMDLNCSFQDPDYKEQEESFMSRKGRGVKRKECVASDSRNLLPEKQKISKKI